jgi:transcriptional regulator with XRE-family HTH domain
MVTLDSTTALGRVIEAARVMAGLDQTGLAMASNVSPSTVSNVENGKDAREDTIRALRRALRKAGVTVVFDRTNGIAAATIAFEEPDEDDD